MKRIEFDGQVHEFPDDFTDEDIGAALEATAPAPRTPRGATGSWAEPAPLPPRDDVTFAGRGGSTAAELFPTTANAVASGASYPRQALGAGVDILTAITRLPRAAARAVDNRMLDRPGAPRDVIGALRQINAGRDAAGNEGNAASFTTKLMNSPGFVAGGLAAPYAANVALGKAGAEVVRNSPALLRALAAAGFETTVATAADQAENVANEGQINKGQAALSAMFGLGIPMGGQIVRTAGRGLSRLGSSQVAEAAADGLTTQGDEALREVVSSMKRIDPAEMARPSGLRLSPAQAANERYGIRPSLETYAQTNPMLQDIPGKIQDANLATIAKTVEEQGQRLGIGRIGGDPQLGSMRGANIASATTDAKKALDRMFGRGETQSLAKIAENALPVNRAMEALDQHLTSAGFKLGSTPNQTAKVGKAAINTVLEMQQEVSQAKTVGELLNVKRNLANKIYEAEKAGTAFQPKDKVFVKSAERKINDTIGSYFEDFLPPEEATAARELWEKINADYSRNLTRVQRVAKKLGVGTENFNETTVIDKITQVDAARLEGLKDAAQELPAAKEMFDEISRGAFESYVKKSLNPGTMELSVDRMISGWNKLDRRVKRAIFPDELVGQMDGLIQDMQKFQIGNVWKANPSGTARQSKINEFFENKTASAVGLLMRPWVSAYYKSGAVPAGSILRIARMGGKPLTAVGQIAGSSAATQTGRTTVSQAAQ